MISQQIRTPADAEHEEEQIRKSQADPEAFKPLYEKYFRKVFMFVLRRVGDKAMAADITSQVFLKALLGLRKFQLRGLPFSAWLFRIAVNECNDFFRQSKRHRIVSIADDMVALLHDEIMVNTSAEDLQARLPHILAYLDPAELTVIELRFFEQRPFKEVADILGITETYAKVKTYRILDKMKKQFLIKA